MASDYDRADIRRTMEKCKVLDRNELVRRPRKKHDGQKKFVLCSKWDPRGPNIHKSLKNFEKMLYLDKQNEKAFPPGSLITGFRRRKNIGEIIAPSKPKRIASEKTCW